MKSTNGIFDSSLRLMECVSQDELCSSFSQWQHTLLAAAPIDNNAAIWSINDRIKHNSADKEHGVE